MLGVLILLIITMSHETKAKPVLPARDGGVKFNDENYHSVVLNAGHHLDSDIASDKDLVAKGTHGVAKDTYGAAKDDYGAPMDTDGAAMEIPMTVDPECPSTNPVEATFCGVVTFGDGADKSQDILVIYRKMNCYQWKRYLFIVLTHLAFAIMYMQRLNLSIALVAMVRTKSQANITEGRNADSANPVREFDWDEAHQGVILSAFFYGYVPLNLPAGLLVDKYGGKIVGGVGLLMSSVCSLLTPIAATNGFYLALMVRVCVGLSQGAIFPALLELLRKWSPTGGKDRLVAMTTAGAETGAVIGFLLGGILCGSKFLHGWPSVFYIFGAVGIIWCVAWTTLVAETPQYDSLPIDEEEETGSFQPLTETKEKENNVPWTNILSSVPLWAIIVGIFCQNWIWFFIITDLPLYYKQVFGIPVTEGGLFSTLPFILALLTHTASGFLTNHLQQWWCVKTVRRFGASTGFFPTALLLIVLSYTKVGDNAQAIIYMTLCAGFSRLNKVTFLSNIIEISPTYTGILMGIANTIAVTAGIGAPMVTGFFTNNNPSQENYRAVFFINAGICAFGGLFFSAFVSGDVQKWDPTRNSAEKDSG